MKWCGGVVGRLDQGCFGGLSAPGALWQLGFSRGPQGGPFAASGTRPPSSNFHKGPQAPYVPQVAPSLVDS